ncbi:MAG TPA: cytochrome c peroxidase [Flavipsychrobacter sp.]|jgi:cytochrome c peroxidase|nr:cytochrome c peroxidase [Flavipsychrobacter sp.]
MKGAICWGVSICFVLSIESCKTDPNLNPEDPYSFQIPNGWPKARYNFENNPVSQVGFELGKKLFFDKRLSRDNTISCGSCHQPFSAFAQIGHDISHGVEDRLGTRNSPPLFNLNWHPSFFWDGGVNHLEVQPINPIQNPLEMDENFTNIIAKLNLDTDYKSRFSTVYGNDSITTPRILKALAQFMGLLISHQSKYDKYKQGDASFTASEISGYTVFQNNCASCHKEPLFSDFSLRNNGLKPSAVNDSGRAHITLNPADLYKFKVPSLRNLKYTTPYMHDGRFSSLEQVLDHYATGIHSSATLDPLLMNGIQLSSQQRSDLLVFLQTLDDEAFIKDKRFQEK